MLSVDVSADTIRIGERFALTLHRTLRVPDDGKAYPLPPGLGTFPLFCVDDYRERLPPAMRQAGAVFVPVYQREALWLGFHGARWKPNAVIVAAGGINVLSGEADSGRLSGNPQNYLVCPDQPWLDGIHTHQGSIRQFVAMPLGAGYTVEASLGGAETMGGIKLKVVEPKPGRFPDAPPSEHKGGPMRLSGLGAGGRMGLGAGGLIRQKIYPDAYGLDTWNEEDFGEVLIHLVDSAQFQRITGSAPPPTPIDAKAYTAHGLPWLALYDETKGDLSPADALLEVKTISARDAELGETARGEHSFDVPESQIRNIPTSREQQMNDTLKVCYDRILPRDLTRPMRTRSIPTAGGAPARAVFPDIRKLWINGSTLRVRFLEGTPEQQAVARDQAAWWSAHANLRFDFNNALDAEIRIAFDASDGAWSYIGTDARSIPQGQPTMNLGFLDGGTAGHEFGHAIGLGHEHQNPAGGIEWNEAVVIRDLGGPPNFWTPEQVRHNVLEKYQVNQFLHGTTFDPKSIMLYAFPGTWTRSGQGTDFNQVLSDMDKAFIASAEAYPPGSTQPTALQVNGTPTQGSIGQPGEEDIYVFSVASPARYALETTGSTDVVMKLFGPDSQTNLIAEDDDSGAALNSKIVKDLSPGNYFIQIRHYNRERGTGAYGIGVKDHG